MTDAGERLRLLEAEVVACGLDAETAVPLLAPVLGIGAEAGYEPVPAEGRKLYELIAAGVWQYLLACVGGGAGLLVAEDVQWFDASTLEVLGALLDASGGRLLVVIAGRPGAWLAGGWPVKVFDLDPLTDEQADTLITALDPSLSAQDRAAVVARCDGVPFYIEQVVRGLGESPGGGSAETGVPDALYEPLFARLRATANVVPVVEAAGIAGRHVDRGLLCSVVDLSEDEIDDVLDELEDALVLEPWGTDGWRFRHELLREVAAEVAPPSVGRGLHAKVADALVGGEVAETRTGGWSPGTTSRRSASTRRPGPTSGHPGCPAARCAGRGPHLPDPGPRAAGPPTRTGPRPPRDDPAVGTGIPRLGRRGRRAAPSPPTSSGACN